MKQFLKDTPLTHYERRIVKLMLVNNVKLREAIEAVELHRKTLEVMEKEFKTPFKTWVLHDEMGRGSQLDAYELSWLKLAKILIIKK